MPYLEAILLLRNDASRSWDNKALAQGLYMSEKAAGLLLKELHAARLLRAHEADPAASYIYDPASDKLRQMIDRVADSYSRHLVEISNLIHSRTARKAQRFADAFKWRKDS
ncbi:MAG: hypothetical protein ACREX0_03380 [Noviherbaspirillum sp.]